MSGRVIASAVAALALAGCGSDDPPPRALAPVKLTVEAPLDAASVTDDAVEVTGRVWPAGTPVLVAGDEAGVSAGRFEATVDLEPGANVIDVAAGAPRRRAAMTAVRVTRLVPVPVPDVEGLAPGEAEAALRDAGFVPELEDRDDLLDELFGDDPGACGTDPPAGDEALPGTTVRVEVRKGC